MELIDLTPGLAPTLWWSGPLPALMQGLLFALAVGVTGCVALVALHVTRRRQRSRP